MSSEMDNCWKTVGAVMIFLTFLTTVIAESTKSSPAECRSHQHAYTTMMRYPDGLEVDEGPYCNCMNQQQPETKWNVDNGNVMTWQHYERAHWTVQYRFCDAKFSNKLKECEGRERAGIMQTAVKEWHPHLAQARCRCPKNKLYQLQGWKKENDQWKYYYNCHKDTCKDKNSTCARITVTEEKDDQGEDSYGVLEMELICACGEGLLCPAKLQDYDKEDLKKTKADFVEKRCESIRQTGKEKTR